MEIFRKLTTAGQSGFVDSTTGPGESGGNPEKLTTTPVVPPLDTSSSAPSSASVSSSASSSSSYTTTDSPFTDTIMALKENITQTIVENLSSNTTASFLDNITSASASAEKSYNATESTTGFFEEDMGSTEFNFSTTTMSASGDDSQEKLEEMIWIIACLTFSLIIFVITTIQYLCSEASKPKAKKKRRLQRDKARRAKEEKNLAEVQRDLVPVEDFLKQLKKKRKKGMLVTEFKALSRLQLDSSCSIGLIQENRKKNAYSDVLPYDHCRVVLDRLPSDPHSDYINASYIDSSGKPKTYIAAQGPNRHTVGDFWRMIWQEKAYCIVMATNVFEHARQQCEKYWHNQHARYGDIDVWLDSTNILADFNIRTFRIRKDGCAEERVICQFQYASWSDHDCPNPTALLEYRRKIRAFLRTHPGPMVVHCGAGAGRTGAFIAIDAALERVSIEKNTDIFNFALYLRSCRQNMIKNAQQYEFIYDCVAMYLQCGVTVINTPELPFVVQRLTVREADSHMTGFEREFKTLQTVVPKLTVGECAGGHRAENRWKSRDIMLQPPERARPYLITHDSNDSTDYINAVYVDGYRYMNAYIVSQWPLRSTVNDVWRLIYDYNIPTAVLLNDISFSRSYPRFWPNVCNKEISYGPLTVEMLEETRDIHIITRVFRIKKMTNNYLNIKSGIWEMGQTMTLVSLQAMSSGTEEPARIVKIFQLRTWPNNHRVPEQADSLLDLLTKVEDWQLGECHGRIPTLVISKNGASRCGIFCGISIAWDRLKSEGDVDIFKVAKTIKHNRPQLICNLNEYVALYYCFRRILVLLQLEQIIAEKTE